MTRCSVDLYRCSPNKKSNIWISSPFHAIADKSRLILQAEEGNMAKRIVKIFLHRLVCERRGRTLLLPSYESNGRRTLWKKWRHSCRLVVIVEHYYIVSWAIATTVPGLKKSFWTSNSPCTFKELQSSRGILLKLNWNYHKTFDLFYSNLGVTIVKTAVLLRMHSEAPERITIFSVTPGFSNSWFQ